MDGFFDKINFFTTSANIFPLVSFRCIVSVVRLSQYFFPIVSQPCLSKNLLRIAFLIILNSIGRDWGFAGGYFRRYSTCFTWKSMYPILFSLQRFWRATLYSMTFLFASWLRFSPRIGIEMMVIFAFVWVLSWSIISFIHSTYHARVGSCGKFLFFL